VKFLGTTFDINQSNRKTKKKENQKMLRINELEYCKLEVEYTAEAELVRSRRDAILTELKNNKTFKIPGFRPGKASKEAIFQHRKGAIKQQLISELSQEGYTDFLFENKVKPLFNPMITSCDLVGDKFWCNMTVLKSPDFELAEYKGLSIAQPALERTLEEDVAETLEGIRQQNGEMNPYGDDDVVEANDILTVSIEGQKQNGDVWTTIPELTKDGMLVYVNKMPALQNIRECSFGVILRKILEIEGHDLMTVFELSRS